MKKRQTLLTHRESPFGRKKPKGSHAKELAKREEARDTPKKMGKKLDIKV